MILYKVLIMSKGHSLSIPNIVTILLKSQLLQFTIHPIHNISFFIYYMT